MILTCIKTGRHWPIDNHAHGDRLARRLGLVDYETGLPHRGDERVARGAVKSKAPERRPAR